MQLFSQILYPTDFSAASNDAIKYAIHLCRQSNANLLVLCAYRLVDEGTLEGALNKVSLKEKLEKQAKARFSVIEKEMLSCAHIHYQFLSDVGFLSDRILVNTQAYQVDLILLCHNMHQVMSDNVQDLLTKQINCPVMFI